MKFALLDDEEFQLCSLKEILLESLRELALGDGEIDTFQSEAAFFADFWRGKYDIIVLDIYMGEANGVETARRIRQIDSEVVLAFCTSSNEFAAETYEVEAKYYLNKPISKEKVKAMLSRFNFASLEQKRTVRLPGGLALPLRQILYTEYSNHSVTFHLKDIAPRSFYMSHGEAEEMLLAYKGFHVANKGCIVNFAQVAAVETNAFVMQNGETVPVARRRFKELEAAYTQYIFDKMVKEVGD